MRLEKHSLQKYFPFENDIRLTLFNFITIVGIVGGWISLIGTIYAGTVSVQIFSVLITELVLNISFYIANKSHKLNLASILIVGVITILCFPVMFFTGGGLNGGMACWFIIGMVFNFMLIEGKIAYVVMIIQAIVNTCCCIVAYCFPDTVTPLNSAAGPCIDIILSMLVVGIGIGLIVRFQVRAYKGALDQNHEQNILLEKANMEAENASKAKSEFLANMSHELRTPINAILGMNEMILLESEDNKIISYSRDIKLASETVLSLINDILDISKIENGKIEIINSKYELGSLINDCFVLIEPRAKAKNLHFFIKNQENIPAVYEGDVFHIRQILINLLTNAVKYTEQGNITLDIRGDLDTQSSNRMNLIISVADTGIGIKKEDINYLFDSFQRVDLDKNRSIEGTGLGLAITKKLVDLMSGSIKIESEYGSGSTFTITLPQTIVSNKTVGNISEHIREKDDNKDREEWFYAPGVRVLVVDDVELNLKVMESLLTKSQMIVDVAHSGIECLDMIHKSKYDLIFLDHMMPKMDGIETRQNMLRIKDNINADTPIIMLTANAIAGMRDEYIAKGFTDYLSKPVNFRELERIIRKYTNV